MSKYYIWKEVKDSGYYTDSEGEGYYWYSPYTNYALARNYGDFHGQGHCCGYYGNTWIENAGVIAQGRSEFIGAEEKDDEVTFKHAYNIELCEDRCIEDCYTGPDVFKAENDEEAIKYFFEYCERNKERWAGQIK